MEVEKTSVVDGCPKQRCFESPFFFWSRRSSKWNFDSEGAGMLYIKEDLLGHLIAVAMTYCTKCPNCLLSFYKGGN